MSESSDERGGDDRAAAPEPADDLTSLGLDELRRKRKEADKEEQELSYIRRLLQGRMDIIEAEIRRRRGEGEELIDSLPRILAGNQGAARRPAQGRFLANEDPTGADDAHEGESALTDGSIADIASQDDRELLQALDSLRAHERSVSDGRARVHELIDRLSAELTRRYRDGTAQVDELLAAARRT
ncbi:MAG: aerial mycelium formation protein [Actinomycetes bacterium]